jgi:hypothetical protein
MTGSNWAERSQIHGADVEGFIEETFTNQLGQGSFIIGAAVQDTWGNEYSCWGSQLYVQLLLCCM